MKKNSFVGDVSVRELIAELSQYDPDLPIVMHDSDGSCFAFLALDVDETCDEDQPEVLRLTLTDDPEEPIE